MGIPVIIIRGILESGKSYFIKDALYRGDFGDLGRLLILSQEEGVEEFDSEFLTSYSASVEYVEKEDWNDKNINELVRKHKPQVIFVECNEMWGQKDIKYPSYFDIQQVMTIIDGTTFNVYFGAMRQLFVDMVKDSEVVLINRCKPIPETSQMKRNLKMINGSAGILALDENGNQLKLESDLPYDLNGEVIKIDLNGFGDFYVDSFEEKERYEGRIVEFECQAMFSKQLPPKTFVAARYAMTCCADDIQIIGHLCSYAGKVVIQNESWIKLRAVVHYVKFRGAPDEQLVLDLLDYEIIKQKGYEEGLLMLK